MKYLSKFNEKFFFRKKDNHITEQDLRVIYDIVDMFADDNNMGKEVIFDEDRLKDIEYYTKYSSRDEMQISVDNNTDINFKFYSNNLEFIILKDRFGIMNLDENPLKDKLISLISKIKKRFPNLKVEWPEGMNKFNVKITKKL